MRTARRSAFALAGLLLLVPSAASGEPGAKPELTLPERLTTAVARLT